MARCHKHKHSSDESAQKCWAKTMRARANKKARQYGVPELVRYKQVKVHPPTVIHGIAADVYMFYTAEEIGP